MKYPDARSLRASLETRLKKESLETGVSLDRLRKECAHQRLLARLAAVSPAGTWALKGGLALITRLGSAARATKDADTSFRVEAAQAEELIASACEHQLGDFFAFELGAPSPLRAEGEQGGLRFAVEARLDGRLFERLQLDVNVFLPDPRPIEPITLRNHLAFAGIEAPIVPVVKIEQHLAEKLHAYSRSYNDHQSSRVKDLFDMLVIAERLPLPSSEVLVAAAKETFGLRETVWPPPLQPPPVGWKAPWAAFHAEHGLRWTTLEDAFAALEMFWRPILESVPRASWSPSAWRWER
jgi:hypothetical protein